jgi:hypothetical protein
MLELIKITNNKVFMNMENRLIDFNNVAFSRDDLKQAESKNKERMILIENQSKSEKNNAVKQQKQDE